jgi:hypothetical protein
MDAIDRLGEALVAAGRRRRSRAWRLRAAVVAGYEHAPQPLDSRLRVALVALALAFTTTAIALAATGVILTGAPVRATKPSASAGEGVPLLGGTRLLPLRAADPAGGLPWGMRLVHTTRGLICVQIGRVENGQLGQLGIDGAFHDDGLFHPLPADALPDVVSGAAGWSFENCAAPDEIYAGDSVGLEASAASNPPRGQGVAAGRREISFGLLGKHAVSITYRLGSATHTQSVLRGLGAYLIVQRYTSGRPLGGVSETDGSDLPFPYSGPADPNGALSAITYRYDGKLCRVTGKEHSRPCGLSEYPPPPAAPLPVVHESFHVHLQIHGRLVTAGELSFRAPYPVTSASEDYYLSARVGRQGVAGTGFDADVARGATVSIPIGRLLSAAGTRSVVVEVNYTRSGDSAVLPAPTTIGSVTIHLPRGTHARPLRLPRRAPVQPRGAATNHHD